MSTATQPIINVLTRTNSESDVWRPLESVSPDYAAHYVQLNRELGWTKYRFVY